MSTLHRLSFIVFCGLEDTLLFCAPVILDTDWDSIVWNTADSVRMNHILAVWDEHVANFHLPKTLARNFCEAGFQIETQQIIPIFNPDFDPNTFSNRLIDLIIPF
jgi:arsenite methyltransferase